MGGLISVPQKQGSLVLLPGAPAWYSCLVLLPGAPAALAWQEPTVPVLVLRQFQGLGTID